jgi:predicted nucleic acid-binding protein
MRFMRVWPLEPSIADQYGAVFLELRRAGRVLSQIDMLQAALLRTDPMILLTTDHDFAALPDIRIEDWT